MKIALNITYDGYKLPDEFFVTHKDKDYREYKYGDTIKSRTDPDVISFIESYGPDGYIGVLTHIIVVDIPDDATDATLFMRYGGEMIAYFQDGKMHMI